LKVLIMLSKKRQKKYLRKRGEEVLGRLHAYAFSREQEALHKMRVEIKKMRSFLKFIKACSGQEYAEDFRPVKKIFRRAGRIRDAYNNNKVIEDYRLDNPDFRRQQDQIQEEESAVFVQHIEEYIRKAGRAGRRMEGSLRGISERCIREWAAGQLMKIAVNFMASSMEEFHKGRKKIKNIQHVLTLLPHKLAMKLLLNEEYLDRLQDAIGKWHDAQVAVGLLKDATSLNQDGLKKLEEETRRKERDARELSEDFYLNVFRG
jgi:CHAD domain-containing protein